MLKCILIEDEPLASELIQDYIKKVPWLTLTASFSTGMEALNFIDNSSGDFDFIILDIKMPQLSGISLLDCINSEIPVIFTTAYSDYAVQSYNYNTIDYLTKPISFERFLLAIRKLNRIPKKQLTDESKEYLFIKVGTSYKKVWFDQIKWIEGMADYVKIVSVTKNIVHHSTLKGMEGLLPNHFIRSHQSYIVNMDEVTEIYGNILKLKDKEIPIGRSFKKEIIDYLNLT